MLRIFLWLLVMMGFSSHLMAQENVWKDKIISSEKEMSCLAHAIYYEARGEPVGGRIAVAEVIVNRANNVRGICDVVYEKNNNHAQFSWAHSSHRYPGGEAWEESQALAKIIMSRYIPSLTDHATYFATCGYRPDQNISMTVKIGTHCFWKANQDDVEFDEERDSRPYPWNNFKLVHDDQKTGIDAYQLRVEIPPDIENEEIAEFFQK